MFLCITRLHNFCINEGCDIESSIESEAESFTFIPSDISVSEVDGSSMLRDIIVEDLTRRVLGRPGYNLERNGSTIN